jgi:hypothetical protein
MFRDRALDAVFAVMLAALPVCALALILRRWGTATLILLTFTAVFVVGLAVSPPRY